MLAVVLLTGCGVDHLLFGELTRGDQVELPPAAPNVLLGSAPDQAGGTITVVSSAGETLEGLLAEIGDDGAFALSLPGNTELSNLVLVAGRPGSVAWGLVPRVERQESVTDGERRIPLEVLQPDMGQLNEITTFATLVVLAKARFAGTPFASLSPGATRAAASEVIALMGADDRIDAASAMVERVLAAGTVAAPLRPFPPEGESYLADAVLGDIDIDGDGTPDAGTEGFDAALAEATTAFEFNACYPEGQIRLVLIADLRAGGLDRNCAEIDRFRWAEESFDKVVFVTGGIHEDTPRCADSPPPCLDDATIDATTAKLGNWEPNDVRLYDDATHGDAVAGDGLWTVTFEMPYFEPAGPEAPGVRIGYKYTFGLPGQGWTGTEEWPGNKRVLELRDINGDHIITRQDKFGDETTNKDKANLLSPAKGGCGSVVFPDQASPAQCVNDSVESMIDTDGDCIADTWPTPGVAAPITVECPEER